MVETTGATSVGAGRRRWIERVTIGALALGAGAAVAWASMNVFAPASPPPPEAPFTLATVTQGVVGSSINLNAVASWPATLAGRNQSVGVVTSIDIKPGTTIESGDALYGVNLRPVVAIEGKTPAFRAMASGDKGADVRQLQKFLSREKYYSGPRDGEFGPVTESAVKEWQEDLGVEPDGAVGFGDVMFVPSLPARVVLNSEAIYLGASVIGAEEAVSSLPAEPKFTIPVTDSQATLMPAGTEVEIQFGQNLWTAVAGGQKAGEEDQVSVALDSATGESICDSPCGDLSITDDTLLPARVITQRELTGLVVPTSALLSDEGGNVYVVDADGNNVNVRVEASARGLSVVTGVGEGLQVRVPATIGAGQ
jgi:peptidoglycan hydrolase-like protein with peptidoglycan-binding domain